MSLPDPERLAASVVRIVTAATSALAPDIRRLVAADIAKAVEPLQQRIAELEARPAALKYFGVHEPARQYAEGAAVTANGNLWIALCATHARPGESSDWQLAVRKGRDGKDAR